ncbi:MAG: DUF2911 domain-containing protein [Acidobacteria bacterium]|nr:DUF2911 domain-containing protein [Acidobacteriota bacterium]
MGTLRTFAFAALPAALFGQSPGLTTPPSGDNQRATVTQHIGPVRVTIDYSSPKVHGPDGKDRRGQIWGKLVPYGLSDLGFGNGKPGPWRAGANENTTFEISAPVEVNGSLLPAGRYGLHMIPGKEEWTIVFSRNSTSWGSFFYEAGEDALRVTAKPVPSAYHEWLTYEFTERKPDRATVELRWEDLALPWSIVVKDIEEVYFTKLSEELRNSPGFNHQGFTTASDYLVGVNRHLETALEWTDIAISRPFVGQRTFTTLSAKARVLDKMGRHGEAREQMNAALKLPSTLSVQIHQYGRQLLTGGKKAEAMEVFLLNQQRFGDNWPVHVGLARGFAAMGDLRKALDHAKKALPQAPDPLNKGSLEKMIEMLEAGKAI